MGYMLDLDEITTANLEAELRHRKVDWANGRCDYCHHAYGITIREDVRRRIEAEIETFYTLETLDDVNDGPCKFPERHGLRWDAEKDTYVRLDTL